MRRIELIFRDDLETDKKRGIEIAYNQGEISPDELVSGCAALLRCIFEETTIGAEEAIEAVEHRALCKVRRAKG